MEQSDTELVCLEMGLQLKKAGGEHE